MRLLEEVRLAYVRPTQNTSKWQRATSATPRSSRSTRRSRAARPRTGTAFVLVDLYVFNAAEINPNRLLLGYGDTRNKLSVTAFGSGGVAELQSKLEGACVLGCLQRHF